MGSWRSKAAAARSLTELTHRLTDRDRAIVADLGRFRLFTLEQLQRLYFDSYSSARDRIASLYETGVLDRFRTGTRAAYRYVLGLHGLRLVHAARIEDYQADPYERFGNAKKPKPGRAPSRAAAQEHLEWIFASAHRPHLEGVNDFYSRLAAACRRETAAELVRWYTEAETDEEIPLHSLRPDGACDLELAHREAKFYFEHDTGTEPLTRLVAKARDYGARVAGWQRQRRERAARPHHRRDSPPLRLILIELTKPGREQNFHQRLAETGHRLPVATTVASRAADPLGPVWRLVDEPASALRRLDRLPTLR